MSATKVFFTADTHLGHANIVRYCKRPWLNPQTDITTENGKERWASPEIAEKRANEMDRDIIRNWNSVVGHDDYVYHLGDFCFGDRFLDYFRMLNGRITLIKGNHDKSAWVNRMHFDRAYDSYKEVEVNGQAITLCHYALRVWNKSHHGAWHLFGHSHGTLPDDPNARSLDIGVDCHNFTPVSFDKVAELMAKKKFVPIDHHTGIR